MFSSPGYNALTSFRFIVSSILLESSRTISFLLPNELHFLMKAATFEDKEYIFVSGMSLIISVVLLERLVATLNLLSSSANPGFLPGMYRIA